MRSSGPPNRPGAAASADPRTEGHVARGGHDARSRRDLLIPALHARPVADRLDQPAGAQLRLPPAQRPAGRGLRRRDVLRPLRDEAAAADRRPRLRRHRLPARRRRGVDRRPGANDRPGRRSQGRRHDDLASLALPRPLRASAGSDVHDRRRTTPDRRRGTGRRRRRLGSPEHGAHRRPSPRLSPTSTRRRPGCPCRRPASPVFACSPASVSSIRTRWPTTSATTAFGP